ncbi:hypothetical protein BaRGS_00034575 [Batillaria attramentaria]|uniref:Uncharacterized protein n=1 Tax=Batillaria attramentaria TaxID=370345 RepID=A0ABD0JID7_9CAEN
MDFLFGKKEGKKEKEVDYDTENHTMKVEIARLKSENQQVKEEIVKTKRNNKTLENDIKLLKEREKEIRWRFDRAAKNYKKALETTIEDAPTCDVDKVSSVSDVSEASASKIIRRLSENPPVPKPPPGAMSSSGGTTTTGSSSYTTGTSGAESAAE